MRPNPRMLPVLFAGIFLAIGPASAGGELSARIDLKGRYYRAGEPVEIRLTLENVGDEPFVNAEGISLLAALQLEVDGETQAPAAVPEFDPSTQPRRFEPGASYQQILELNTHFPALQNPGTYRVRFQAGEITAEGVELFLAHPYDTDLDYVATLKTDFGNVTFDLLEEVAPDHVRNFVDLSRGGFYDDTLFTIIARGEIIVAGDRIGDGSGGTGYVLPPELSALPHERGTLASVRTSGNDNGSQFFVDLRRDPDRDGNFSIFGKLLSGEQTLAALEGISTTGQNYQPFFKPLTDTFVRGIVIQTKGGSPDAGVPTDEDPAPEPPTTGR